MISNIAISIGDDVVCINDDLPSSVSRKHIHVMGRIKKGRVYRVVGIIWLYGEKGVHLEAIDHRPTDGWRASRFRKVQPVRRSYCSASVALESR